MSSRKHKSLVTKTTTLQPTPSSTLKDSGRGNSSLEPAITHSVLVSQTKQNVSERRSLFAKTRFILPHDQRVIAQESRDDDWVPFCITLVSVGGLPRMGKSAEDAHIEYEVRLHFYDVTYKMFFGRTWVGPRCTIKTQSSKLHYNTPVYFHTSLADPNIVLVIEVVQVTATRGNDQEQLASCGWGILRLFHQGDFTDSSQSTPAPVKRLDLFHGSPRALFFLGDDLEGSTCKKLIVSDIQVCYTICTHRYMDKIQNLVPQNVLLSGGDYVPGVAVVDSREGGDNFRRPKPLKKLLAVIDKISVLLYPNADQFEEELCSHLNFDRLAMEQNAQSDKTSVVVSERRLKIGVHNGWGYIGKLQTVFLDKQGGVVVKEARKTQSESESSGSAGDSALLAKSKVTLSDLVDDPGVSIVFLLEYITSSPTSMQERKLTTSFNRIQSQQIALRWAAWSPDFKENICEVSAQLLGGPGQNPNNVCIYKNQSANVSDKEMARLAAGKLNFTVKLKDAGLDQKKHLPSSASVPASSLTTDQGSFYSRSSLPRSPSTPVRMLKEPLFGPATSQRVSPQQHAPRLAETQPDEYKVEVPHGKAQIGDLEELPFTPDSAPIIPVASYTTSGPGLSRVAFAHLYQAGFPEILDRHGEVADVIHPTDHVVLNMQKENTDPLQCNEIVLQFLAFSRVLQFDQSSSPSLPRSTYFTFQFYRYPTVTTERLLLGNVEGKLTSYSQRLPCVLHKMKNDESPSDDAPGLMMRYKVDPALLKPGEGRLFLRYLYHQTLHIDVWDGDTLLLLGTCAVELKHLLRCGHEAVQVTHELDVISRDYNEQTNTMTGDLTRGGSVHPVGVQIKFKGYLHVRLANIGHPEDKRATRAETMTLDGTKTVIHDDSSGAFLGGSVNLGMRSSGLDAGSFRHKRSYVASHIGKPDRDLASTLLSTYSKPTDNSSQEDTKKQRKAARMEAVRIASTSDGQSEGLNQTLQLQKEEKFQRSRDLKTMEIYRDRNKKDGILSMLHMTISKEHTIYPSFGYAEFFEYELKNPYNVQHTVSIQWDDPELSVVTDPEEWKHLKQIFETNTALEENMFNKQHSPRLGVFLRPKERVHIPFKFQSFGVTCYTQPQGPHLTSRPLFETLLPPAEKPDGALGCKNVKVHFKTEDNKCIAILSVNVEPQPPIIDQTFRFNHPEQTFLKKSIRLPPFQPISGLQPDGEALSQLYVICSDKNALCEARRVPAGEPQDVYIKVASGISPSIKKLFVLIYSSPYMSRPLQTWQMYIHALQRVDVSCIEGQTSRQSVILRGLHTSRLVQCFPSHPNEMQIFPSEPFMLLANSVHEVRLGVRPTSIGTRFMYINVVDKEYHQLVQSWFVHVQCRQPLISKVFELHLPVGGVKGSNKRITYTNPYQQSKVFNLRCNRNDLLQFKETKVQIAGGETYALGLHFTQCQQPGTAEILIFINDDQDNNEETFSIRASYT